MALFPFAGNGRDALAPGAGSAPGLPAAYMIGCSQADRLVAQGLAAIWLSARAPAMVDRDPSISLAALDYPNFEVLVIDNTQGIPAGVANGCRLLRPPLGEAFSASSIFDVHEGLQVRRPIRSSQTGPTPEDHRGVIDRDYSFRPNWLKALGAAFR